MNARMRSGLPPIACVRAHRHQQHRRAVDAARERDRHRLIVGNRLQPPRDRLVRRRDVRGASLSHIGRAESNGRVEEAVIARRRIGTANLIELDDVVSRDHARVGRVELPGDPLLAAPREDLIHPLGHDEERPVIHLRDEVAQRDADRPRQPHGLPVAGGHGEVAIGGTKRRRVAAPDRGDHLVCRTRRSARPCAGRPDR